MYSITEVIEICNNKSPLRSNLKKFPPTEKSYCKKLMCISAAISK